MKSPSAKDLLVIGGFGLVVGILLRRYIFGISIFDTAVFSTGSVVLAWAAFMWARGGTRNAKRAGCAIAIAATIIVLLLDFLHRAMFRD